MMTFPYHETHEAAMMALEEQKTEKRKICIIPARRDSKRIIFKNIRKFCGRPIIEYPLTAAMRSCLFDDIKIYTNDPKIKKYYKYFSFDRNEENASDSAPLASMLMEFIEDFSIDEDTEILVILPTAIFAAERDIILSHGLLKNNDAVVAAMKHQKSTYHSFQIDNGLMQLLFPECQFMRTQDVKNTYYDAGQFYWINCKSFIDQKTFYMKKTELYIMHDAIDIDTDTDWENAEKWYYKNFLKGEN